MAWCALGMAGPAGAGQTAWEPRVEGLERPLGLDAPQPTFSWPAPAPGTRQTAYRVAIASSDRNLSKPDVWDTGKVVSAAQVVRYGGPPLSPLSRYAVQVWVWDDRDRPAWSKPTAFETGFLDPNASAWKAKWIGLRAAGDDERRPFVGARWLVPPPLDTGKPLRRMAFTRPFPLPDGEAVARAELFFVGVSPAGSPFSSGAHHLYVNEHRLPPVEGDLRTPRRFDVTGLLRPGDNQLWVDSPFSDGGAIIAVLRLESSGGRVRFVPSDRTWQVRTTTAEAFPEGWRQDQPDKAPYVPSAERGAFGESLGGSDPAFAGIDHLIPPALFRKPFTVSRPLARARLFVTAAGVYEAFLNGVRVGEDVLGPGFGDYARGAAYQVYDVTALVRRGPNVLGARLGDGWYAGGTAFGAHVWGFDKALRAELHLRYHDGSTEVHATDPSWRGHTGAVRHSDLLEGEVVDARREPGGWWLPGFDDGGWRAAYTPDVAIARFEGQPRRALQLGPPVHARATFSPRPGVQIFDLGQVITGKVRFRFRAGRGTQVTFRYGLEADRAGLLPPPGTGPGEDRYTAAGRLLEVFEPRFSLRSFRFVEVSGAPNLMATTALVGLPYLERIEPAAH